MISELNIFAQNLMNCNNYNFTEQIALIEKQLSDPAVLASSCQLDLSTTQKIGTVIMDTFQGWPQNYL